MSETIDIISNKLRFKNQLNFIIFGVVSTFIFIGLVYLTLQNQTAHYLLAIIFAIPITWLFIKYPKIWLYSIAATSFVFLRDSEKGVSLLDVAFGAYYIAGTIIWIFWKLFVHKEKLILNIGDWTLVFFYLLALLNIPIAVANDVKFIDCTREYILYTSIFIYFPIRYYFKEKKELNLLLILFGISIFIMCIAQFRLYKQVALTELNYAYQLASSVRLNQTIFSSAIIFGLLMSMLQTKIINKLIFFVFIASSIGALILSLSRTFWVVVAFEIVIIYIFYFNKKYKLQTLIGTLLIILVASITISLVFKNASQLMVQVLEKRLKSSTEGTKDISLQLRLIEYDAAFKELDQTPLGGTGFGNTVKFYEPNVHFYVKNFNIHNAFLYLFYRVGFPLGMFFFITLIYYLSKGIILSTKIKDTYYKFIVLSAVGSLIINIGGSLLSAQFFLRDGCFALGFSYALISIINNIYIENRSKTLNL